MPKKIAARAVAPKKRTLSKKQLIEKLDYAVVTEELAIPLYTTHIEQTLFWSGLAKAKQKKIVTLLKTLNRESKAHVVMLKKVKKLVNA